MPKKIPANKQIILIPQSQKNEVFICSFILTPLRPHPSSAAGTTGLIKAAQFLHTIITIPRLKASIPNAEPTLATIGKIP